MVDAKPVYFRDDWEEFIAVSSANAFSWTWQKTQSLYAPKRICLQRATRANTL